MGAETKIEWCHHTFNPWWGCQRVSPGCEHCYAETFSRRVGLKVWGPTAERRFFGQSHWLEPLKWNGAAEKAGERRRVFCASMADVFEDRAELEPHRQRLCALIMATPSLDWLLLTKRPENMIKMAPDSWAKGWPRNVWAGTTTESQRYADERLPQLLEVPAAVRFVSAEPLLEGVDMSIYVGGPDDQRGGEAAVDWVIIGGESGPGARPFCTSWAMNIIADCEEAGTPVFCKQLGAHPYRVTDEAEDLNVYDPADVAEWYRLKDRKGGTMSEWPSVYLRKREFPREVRR